MNFRPAVFANRYQLAAILLLAFSSPILAQQPPQGRPADRTNPERARQQDMSRREYQLRNFGLEPKTEADQRKMQALAEQIEQDFSRILLLHNQIARAISSEQKLDYHFVSDAAEEIRKRASRLQSTLALRESESAQDNSEKTTVLDHAQIRASLLTLCKQIKSFVTNPVIETPGTINVEQLEKARHDLGTVIKLSGQIKKDAEKLDKAKH